MKKLPFLFTAPYYPDTWNTFDILQGRPNVAIIFKDHYRTVTNTNFGGGSQVVTRSVIGHEALGKYYFELLINNVGGGSNQPCLALYPRTGSLTAGFPSFTNLDGWGFNPKSPPTNGCFVIGKGANFIDLGSSIAFANGNRLMVAADFDEGRIWYGYNNSWLAGGNPGAGTNALFADINAYGSGVGIHTAVFLAGGGGPGDSVTGSFIASELTYTKPTGYFPWNSTVTPTWNPDDWASATGGATAPVFSNGNRTVTGGSAASSIRSMVSHASGKWYFELVVDNIGSSSNPQPVLGICTTSAAMPPGASLYWAILNDPPNASFYHSGSYAYGTGLALANGSVVMCAIDVGANKVWMGQNGTWYNSGNPAAGTGNVSTGIVATMISAYVEIDSASSGVQVTCNMKASEMAYSVPSGFTAWGKT